MAPMAVRHSTIDRATAVPDFKQMLQQQIEQVNRLQHDASLAIHELAASRQSEIQSVLVAAQKADRAFKMLLEIRNKVMDAYQEIKQIQI